MGCLRQGRGVRAGQIPGLGRGGRGRRGPSEGEGGGWGVGAAVGGSKKLSQWPPNQGRVYRPLYASPGLRLGPVLALL